MHNGRFTVVGIALSTFTFLFCTVGPRGDAEAADPLPLAPSDWAMLQGNPRHDGYQPLQLNAANFVLRWTTVRGPLRPYAATGDGKVFVVGGRLVALDGSTGAEVWARQFGAGSSMSAPSFAGDLVYVHTTEKSETGFWAFRKDTGAFAFRGVHASSSSQLGPPTIFDDRVYAIGRKLEVFNALTGARLWQVDAVDFLDCPTPAIDAERVFVTKDGDLQAMDRLTGAELFVIDANASQQVPVLGSRGNVLVGGGNLTSFDSAARKVAWKVAAAAGTTFGMPAVGNGVVFCVQSGVLVAYGEADGEQLWQWSPDLPVLNSNVVVTASHVFVGSGTTTYAVDLATRLPAWSFPQGGALALGNDGALIIVGNDSVTAIEIEGDTDGDGVPQYWERRHGGDLDPRTDDDADGLTALAEYEHGTDPGDADGDDDGLSDGAEATVHGTAPSNPDTDGDGLSDSEEVVAYGSNPCAFDTDADGLGDGVEASHGFAPCDASDGAADPDGDTYANRHEILAGTDPHDGASFPVPSDWGMLQGNARHDGCTPLLLDPTHFSVRWKITYEWGSASSVATGDGKVFTVADLKLRALDAGSGAELWARRLHARGSISPPSFANDLVYVHTSGEQDTALCAFREDTGEEVFRAPHTAQRPYYSAPTIFADRAYVNGDSTGGVEAFDALTGTSLWRSGADAGDYWEPAVDGEHVFVLQGGDLRVLHLLTGSEEFVIAANVSTQTPVLGSRGNVLTGGANLASFDTATHKAAWKLPATGATYQMPAVASGVVYNVQGGALIAVREADGARLWQWHPVTENLSSNVVVTASHAFVGGATTTYALDLQTRFVVWSCPLGGTLALDKTGVLFIAAGYDLAAIELEGDTDGDGLPQWWERRYGGDLDPQADDDEDGLAALAEYEHRTDPTNDDSDGDGLSDGEEVLRQGTNPNDPDSDKDELSDGAEVTAYGSDPLAFDTDGDRIQDGMEASNGIDPCDPSDSAGDFDGDGYTNLHEVFAGADPRDPASVPALSDWAMLQGNPSHNGYQPSSTCAASFAPRWTVTREGRVSAAATGDNKAFLIDGQSLVALDAGTGKELWVRPVDVIGAISAPSFANDLVYVHTSGDRDTALWAFRKDTGEQVFRAPHKGQWEYYRAPTVFGNQAYVNGALFGGVQVFDALTGASLWSTDRADSSDSWEPAVDGGHVVVPCGGALRVLHPLTGEELLLIEPRARTHTPILGSRGNVLTGNDWLGSFDLTTGAAVWTVRTPGRYFTIGAVGNGVVFIPNGNILVARREATGEELWQWQSPDAAGLTANMVVTAHHAFVTSESGTYAIDLATHQTGWSCPQTGTLSLGKEGVLIIAGGNTVTAIEVEDDTDGDGMPQWWERRYGGNLDPGADDDGDGLATLGEYEHRCDPTDEDSDDDGLSDGAEVTQHRTNPIDPDSDKDTLPDADEVATYATDPASFDTDGDGIDDGAELSLGFDPCNAADGAADFDGDGYANRHEIFAGSDFRDPTSVPVRSDWGMVQGNPSHRGYQPSFLDPADFFVRWKTTRDGNVSSVATGDGKIFLVDGRNLVALDAETGADLWVHAFGGNTAIGAPSFGNRLVYVHTGGAGNAAFWAFRKETGTLYFRAAHSTQQPTYCAPTIFGSRAYVNGGTYGGVQAFDALNGLSLWNMSDADASTSWEPAVDDERVVALRNGDLLVLDLHTGQELFKVDARAPAETPVLGTRGNVLVGGASLASFDLASRKAVWEMAEPQGSYFSMPAVGNGVVFCVRDGCLVAASEVNGQLLWQWQPQSRILSSNVVVTASHVFVGTSTATYAIDLLTHKDVWSHSLPGALALSKEGVLVIAGGNTVMAVEIEEKGTRFMRADANVDGRVDVGDAVRTLDYLFEVFPCPCVSALDANDDGWIDTSDAVFVLYYLFLKGPRPPSPFGACAADRTHDGLDCETYELCTEGK